MILSPSSLTEIPTSSQTRDTVKMIALWITLLFLHRASTLVPVKTVQLGEPATFTCALPNKELSTERFHWYKQSIGDNLKLIVTVWKSTTPKFAPKFSDSRFVVHSNSRFSSLTILRTNAEDDGIYHCAILKWNNAKLNGTYLMVKGNSQRTSHYTVIQQSTASDPVRPGDSVTLQCSVLSDSDTKTCPGGHSVFWVRVGSHTSHPDIIYTDGNRHDECERRSDSQRSCVYHLSKNISSSDAGTYYCAVVTCGQILFGNGSTLDIVQTTRPVSPEVVILIVSLAFSVIGNVFLLCKQRAGQQCKRTQSAVSAAQNDASCRPVHDTTEDEDQLNYAALNFPERKVKRGRKKRELAEDSVYSQVKY